MRKPWIVLGGGGHAKVVIDALLAGQHQIVGFTSPETEVDSILGVMRIGDDDALEGYSPEEVVLANGLGSVGSSDRRRKLYLRFSAQNYPFPPLLHPSAVVAASVSVGSGVQVLAGAVVQSGCCICENAILNTRSSVDHDCIIGAHVHVAPGATLSGGVLVGEGAHVGTGASVIQGVTIGAESVVGAGAAVVRDVLVGSTVVGVPAKERTP